MSPKEKEVKREEAEKVQKINLPIYINNKDGEEEEEDSFAA